MWDLPGPGLEPVSPALAGGFLTTVLPGKPLDGEIEAQKGQCIAKLDWSVGKVETRIQVCLSLTLSLVFFSLHFVAEVRKYSLYISDNRVPTQSLEDWIFALSFWVKTRTKVMTRNW